MTLQSTPVDEVGEASGPPPAKLVIGMDVGSTTVKAVVIDPVSKEILWSDYQRHLTKQPEKVMELLLAIQSAFAERPFEQPGVWRMFLTGSGSGPLAKPTGGKFVQEVNAVTLAVEHLHPDVLSVIELGGQDAKIIMFKEDAKTGAKTAGTSMNDKCASGTGATTLPDELDASPRILATSSVYGWTARTRLNWAR